MKVVTIGGGPAALYFSILMKKAFPGTAIRVHERNRADDTFGWGVVFSRETLGNLQEADPETFEAVSREFVYWDDIETCHRGRKVVSTGHGFCGLSRARLLRILQQRAARLGVGMHFEDEVTDLAAHGDADLLVGADGVNSMVRRRLADHLRPSIDWRRCRFCWLGTDLPLEAFTFIFKESPKGLFQVHAYPFECGLSTWIVECHEDVWRRAGLDEAGEEETVAFCEELFAEELRGHRLLTNRSIWRSFPTVRNESWHHQSTVLLGDAAHTAHFSIGSGTKLAMEDAIALVESFVEQGTGNVPRVLETYESKRRIEVLKLQKAAQTSLEWFENASRYLDQDPVLFTFNLLTRSKRVTYDNLRLRDPAFVDRVDRVFAEARGAPRSSEGQAPPPMFTPFRLRSLELQNRVVVSPMCQYSAREGHVGDWHLVHLGSRALGGAGLVMTEMTDVSPDGRITTQCAGLYEDGHTASWKRIVDFVHTHTRARIGIQLAHAGRKGSCHHRWEGPDVPLKREGWATLAPSPLPFAPGWPVPREMDRRDMESVREAFRLATLRAAEAGFDLVEVHMAHGYLLSSFISPLCNHRRDAYGGPLENRMRYPLEVLEAVRGAWPRDRPVAARITASDWRGDEGSTPEESVEVARLLGSHGCDLVDVSSGGNVPHADIVYGRMYQVPFAERIRYETGLPVMAVGAILGWDHCNTILAAERADLCAMARPHLRDPYLTLHAAEHYGFPDQPWPGQYLPARPRPTR